jgi:hypothetical protein
MLQAGQHGFVFSFSDTSVGTIFNYYTYLLTFKFNCCGLY